MRRKKNLKGRLSKCQFYGNKKEHLCNYVRSYFILFYYKLKTHNWFCNLHNRLYTLTKATRKQFDCKLRHKWPWYLFNSLYVTWYPNLKVPARLSVGLEGQFWQPTILCIVLPFYCVFHPLLFLRWK